MEDLYFVSAPLNITFEELDDNNKAIFNAEFNALSEVEIDPIGHWLKMKKAKGETEESDAVLLDLIMELHRKIDRLETLIKGENIEIEPLEKIEKIESVGFNHFQLESTSLIKGNIYYGRVSLKSYPQRDIPIFFKALSENIAIFDSIHERDEKDWGIYFRARERVMIREKRRS